MKIVFLLVLSFGFSVAAQESWDYVGDLDLSEYTSITEEGFPELPESVSGDVHLDNLERGVGLVLPKKIGGSLFLNRLQVAIDVQFPDYVGGSLHLSRLVSADGVRLPRYVGVYLNLDSVNTGYLLALPETVGVGILLRNLTSLEGALLPSNFRGRVYLDGGYIEGGVFYPN